MNEKSLKAFPLALLLPFYIATFLFKVGFLVNPLAKIKDNVQSTQNERERERELVHNRIQTT